MRRCFAELSKVRGNYFVLKRYDRHQNLIFEYIWWVKTILNVDGEDWKRDKWRGWEKAYLKVCVRIATVFPHIIISDSQVIRKRYLRDYQTETLFIHC